MSEASRIKKISGNWYIETRIGYDGPFDSKLEASQFLSLLKSTEAARSEFAGLQFIPYE
mgnify:CR=1 FL=1